MSDACALWVDHVGILGPTADGLAQTYTRLGFNVVGPVALMGTGTHEEPVDLGQQSAHIMFGSDYIELTAVTRPSPQHHLAPFLKSAGGLRLIILGTDDIAADHRRCTENGLEPSAIGYATRDVQYGSCGTARFEWFGLPISRYPEALMGYVQHRTPEIVFQAEVSQHSNTAIGISRIVLQADQVPHRFKVLTCGRASTKLEAKPQPTLKEMSGNDYEGLPQMRAVGLYVSDLNATQACLAASSVEYLRHDHHVYVQPHAAGGVGIIFEQAH